MPLTQRPILASKFERVLCQKSQKSCILDIQHYSHKPNHLHQGIDSRTWRARQSLNKNKSALQTLDPQPFYGTSRLLPCDPQNHSLPIGEYNTIWVPNMIRTASTPPLWMRPSQCSFFQQASQAAPSKRFLAPQSPAFVHPVHPNRATHSPKTNCRQKHFPIQCEMQQSGADPDCPRPHPRITIHEKTGTGACNIISKHMLFLILSYVACQVCNPYQIQSSTKVGTLVVSNQLGVSCFVGGLVKPQRLIEDSPRMLSIDVLYVLSWYHTVCLCTVSNMYCERLNLSGLSKQAGRILPCRRPGRAPAAACWWWAQSPSRLRYGRAPPSADCTLSRCSPFRFLSSQSCPRTLAPHLWGPTI